jgi:hypothetical protein
MVILVFLLPLVSLFCVPGVRSEGPNPDVCSLVSIDLPKETYKSAAFVSAKLKTRGPTIIYYWPPHFLAQRKSGAIWLPAPSKGEILIRPKLHAIPFHFDSPKLIGIDWMHAGSELREGSFTVPAGHYRLALRFIVDEPAGQQESAWCTVNSKEIVLEESAPTYVTK